MKDEEHALGMNEQKVTLFNLRNMKVIGTLAQENEEISTFALSPNQQYLATSNRSALIRIFKMPEVVESHDFSKLECVGTFRTPNQLVLEMTFDPSSKFLAVGTSDSHIKVFDVARNF
jgi:WD40 repeat protein